MIDNKKLLAWAREAFYDAVEKQDHETVSRLLDAGMDPNDRWSKMEEYDGSKEIFFPLAQAACNGDFKMVEILLQAGADFNAVVIDSIRGEKQSVFDVIDECICPERGGLYPEQAEAMKAFISSRAVCKAFKAAA